MARAVCEISATSRWAITGTPIQNQVSDFSSLLEYLRIDPFSTAKVFDDEIVKPWLKSADRDVARMKKLVNCISLCRTKKVIDLPEREDLIRNLNFSPEEQKHYDRVKEGTIRKLDDALSSNPLKAGQYLNALQWLNELRLLCNHGLVEAQRGFTKTRTITQQDTHTWNKSTANKAFEAIVCANEATCSLCGNVLSEGVGASSDAEHPKLYLSKCLMLTCGSCIRDSPSNQSLPTCSHIPLCKSVEVSWNPGAAIPIGTKERNLPNIPEEHVPIKIKTLLNDLQACPEGEKRYISPIRISLKFILRILRSVVFSYWTFTLDLVEWVLRKHSITYTRIDGQHSAEEREEAIDKFQTDASIQVILVSITCGGAG
jgi:SWI/SNF-related matrix-associated actin-dependent regulator of chromatin subfamily A3